MTMEKIVRNHAGFPQKLVFNLNFGDYLFNFVSFCGKTPGSIHIGVIWLCGVCPADCTRALIFYVLTIQIFTPAEQLL